MFIDCLYRKWNSKIDDMIHRHCLRENLDKQQALVNLQRSVYKQRWQRTTDYIRIRTLCEYNFQFQHT